MTTGWRRALAVLALLTTVGCGQGSTAELPATRPVETPHAAPTSPAHSPSAAPTASPTASPTGSSSPSASATQSPAERPSSAPRSPLLGRGDQGRLVRVLQQRLTELGYWLDDAPGIFGDTTQQAVYAVQKAAGLTRDGVVGPHTRAALTAGVRPQARTTSGSAVEVDLEHQLVLIVVGGSLRYILNASTGGGYAYVQEGHTYLAVTPRGQFRVLRRIDGWDHAPLGWLWRPAYFEGGYALHGYTSVPPFPASHGCVRVSIPAMNWIWASGFATVGSALWVY